MTQEQILESNKIIAEFMGAEITQAYSKTKEQDGVLFYYPKDTSPSMYRNLSSSGIKYHKEWDWLMPVVDKLEELGYEININGNDCYVQQPNRKGRLVIHCKNWINKLQCVYQAVISTINWHNLQEK